MSPDVAAILRRARSIGECSWRVGIALGVDPAALERLELGLDRLGVPACSPSSMTKPAVGGSAQASGSGRSGPPPHHLDADYSQRDGAGDEHEHLTP